MAAGSCKEFTGSWEELQDDANPGEFSRETCVIGNRVFATKIFTDGHVARGAVFNEEASPMFDTGWVKPSYLDRLMATAMNELEAIHGTKEDSNG